MGQVRPGTRATGLRDRPEPVHGARDRVVPPMSRGPHPELRPRPEPWRGPLGARGLLPLRRRPGAAQGTSRTRGGRHPPGRSEGEGRGSGVPRRPTPVPAEAGPRPHRGRGMGRFRTALALVPACPGPGHPVDVGRERPPRGPRGPRLGHAPPHLAAGRPLGAPPRGDGGTFLRTDPTGPRLRGGGGRSGGTSPPPSARVPRLLRCRTT